jgi:glutamate-1-semialdehyde 2,1-aminomutase
LTLDYGNRLASFMAESMTHPLVAETMMTLVARQPTSMALVERLRRSSSNSPVLWPFHAMQVPLSLAEARGSRVVDVDGNEYLDAFLCFGTQSLFGHNPPDVVDAVREILGRSVGNATFHQVQLDHTELLLSLWPFAQRVLFVNSGTDATAAAVRLARAHTGRRLIVKFDGAIHGTHDWGMLNSFALMHGHPVVPFPEPSDEGFELKPFGTGVPVDPDVLVLPLLAPDTREVLARHRHEIAAVIAEPCCTAFPFPERSVPWVKSVAEACRDLGVLFILDEVQTGFRYDIGGAAVKFDIPADLVCYGKVLSGLGLPLAAVAGKASILDRATTSGFSLGDYGQKTTFMSTHHGAHLSMAASHASISKLVAEGPAYHERARRRLARLRERLAVLHDEGIPLHLVGFGEFIGSLVFFRPGAPLDGPRDVARAANPSAGFLLSLMLRARGVHSHAFPLVFLGDAHTDDEIETLADVIVGAARAMKDAGFPLIVT